MEDIMIMCDLVSLPDQMPVTRGERSADQRSSPLNTSALCVIRTERWDRTSLPVCRSLPSPANVFRHNISPRQLLRLQTFRKRVELHWCTSKLEAHHIP